MIPSRLLELDSALDSFLERFFPAFVTRQTFHHLHAYARGLLSDLPRKSVEPIALQSGIPVRTLQEFLRDHVWDFSLARNLLQQQVAQQLTQMPNDGLGTVGLIDETSVLKKGKMTPGVQRQYLGCVGKVDNGIVTVHLGVSRQRYKTLIDADLFLPESWSDDRPRCRLAGIPDELTHRTKWQIAREQLLRAQANGVILDWLTFDEGYGSSPAFLLDLSQRQQSFVGEVPRSLRCLAAAKHGKKPEERIPAKRLRRWCATQRHLWLNRGRWCV